jgi:molybdopterin molybdotransferase
MPVGGHSREFLTVRTVAEARAGFRPGRRTGTEAVPLAAADGRVPARDVRASHDLPGFARSTVDGWAVRAADTYGASDGLPGYLDVVGAVVMGRADAPEVPAGGAVEIPTGGALPAGADAVLMLEHGHLAMPGTIEVGRPVAPGDGVVRADEDVAAGAILVPAGRPLRSSDVGLLAAAGVTSVDVHRRPRVAIFSTGDEVVAADVPALLPGQVRDATAPALAALVRAAGGEPLLHPIVPDDPSALRSVLEEARADADVLVVSAGSSVGARDATAAVVADLGTVWCHGLAVRPGKPTLLADLDEVPLIGLPGHPLSALVVFRLLGVPLVRLVGGCTHPLPEGRVAARLTRAVPSAAGRLDAVQIRLGDVGRDGLPAAEPLFGRSAQLSLLSRADGFLLVEEDALGLEAGAVVAVLPHG